MAFRLTLHTNYLSNLAISSLQLILSQSKHENKQYVYVSFNDSAPVFIYLPNNTQKHKTKKASHDFGGSAVYGGNPPRNNFDDNHNNNNSNNMYQQSPVRGLNNNNNSQYFERSLIPTTVKQILIQPSPGPDEPFCIDGKPIHQISVIGILININPQSTHTLFTIDDQKAMIKCKLWSSDDDDIKQIEKDQLKNGDLVKIIGKIDTFKNIRSINIHHIEKIIGDKHNIIAMHGIEAILAHELNSIIVNQHIPHYKQKFDAFIMRSQNEHEQQKKDWENYKEKQQQNNNNQSPQGGFNRNRNHNNHNNNNNNNSGGNRYANNNNNNNNNNNSNRNGDETNLGQLEKSILLWMRGNKHRGRNGIGHSRENIKKAVRCFDDQAFSQAIRILYDRGLIQDTIEDNFDLVQP